MVVKEVDNLRSKLNVGKGGRSGSFELQQSAEKDNTTVFLTRWTFLLYERFVATISLTPNPTLVADVGSG